jgi:hypothetical protein
MSASNASNPLLMLAGEWLGQETIAASQWGAAGQATARISTRGDFDDRVLIHDYQAERDGKPWLKAHAVFAFDGGGDRYQLFWFDSLGYRPSQPAAGHWNGESLIFARTSPRGQTRHAYTPLSGDCYAMKLESSFDGGSTWLPVMEGIYTRIG